MKHITPTVCITVSIYFTHILYITFDSPLVTVYNNTIKFAVLHKKTKIIEYHLHSSLLTEMYLLTVTAYYKKFQISLLNILLLKGKTLLAS